MTANNLLEVRNLNKKFYTKRGVVSAIDDVSFVVPAGKVVGLIGESGSGKTTIGRTIMNLHQADSGSIKIDGREIGGKRLSRQQKKDLYWNIQMIFQDPYSSLNPQKNIMSILRESLTAKHMHRQMLAELLRERKEVITYFGLTLCHDYQKAYYRYRNEANARALAILPQIENSLTSFVIDPQASISHNFARLKEESFEQKDILNYAVLNHSDDLVSHLFTIWKKAQNDFHRGAFAFDDEINLKKATEEFRRFEQLASKTERQMDLEAKLITANEELRALHSEWNHLRRQTVVNRRKIKSNIHRELRRYRDEAALATKGVDFNHLQYLIHRETLLLKLLRASEQATKKTINNTLASDVDAARSRIDHAHQQSPVDIIIPKMGLITPALEQEIIATFVASHHDDTENLKHKIAQQEASVSALQNDISHEKTLVQPQDGATYKQVKMAYETAKAEFKANTAQIKSTTESEMAQLVAEYEKPNNDASAQIAKLEKTIIGNVQKLLQRIISECTKGDEFATKRQEAQAVKAAYRRLVADDKELQGELRRNFHDIEVLKTMMNFGKRHFTLITKRLLSRSLLKQKVFATLEEVGLNRSHAYRYPHEFSGGMRQRVGIARAIISSPKLIIADEPIAALDLSIQAQIVNLLLQLKRDRQLSMIFIAHDLSMVEYNSDYVLIMHYGKVVEHGDTEKIFAHPSHPYTINLIQAMPSLDKITEPLGDKRFNATYREQYSALIKPQYHKVTEGHYVLATPEQAKEWINRK